MRLTDFTSVNEPQTVYSAAVGLGASGDHVGADLGAAWFSGEFDGVAYDRVLVLSAEIGETAGGVEVYKWATDPLDNLLQGLDPGATQLDLKNTISGGGREFAGFYRLGSDDDADWVEFASHSIPLGVNPSTGFSDAYPFVRIDASAVVPLPPAAWLLASALAFLGLGRRRHS